MSENQASIDAQEDPSADSVTEPVSEAPPATEDVAENGGDGIPPSSDGAPPGQGGGGGVNRVSLTSEVEQSYMGYAMSVIIGRALPDVRDGLKPVHRRCLFAMSEMGIRYNRPTIKSARVQGEVHGKYHPHSDQSIYETIARMAQEFLMRYPLVDGQGNFGSVDGDPPAASRYTEMRMTRLAEMLLADLDKETVDFVPNYDETLTMPLVLPTRFPNLLVNGSDGIAVAMATKMPPHNLGEVIDACVEVVNNPDATLDDLLQHVQGPDFPTSAIINGRAGIVDAYRTGRGTISIRSRAEIVQGEQRDTIVVSEIPFQVNKALLISKIADLVKAKKIEGITELRDESDKDGLRIVIELRRGEIAQTVLNNLYRHTALELTYAINNNALVNGEPKQVSLKEIIVEFLAHRREVIARRTVYLLRQSRSQGHVLEGQAVALANIDEIVELIKSAGNREEAHQALRDRSWEAASIEALLSRAERDIVRPLDLEDQYGFQSQDDEADEAGQYRLSPRQANAILDLRLHRLTNLEQQELVDNYKEIVTTIRELLAIQDSDERVDELIIEELLEVKEQFADERRTEIRDAVEDLTDKALIKPQDVVITISHQGYAKAMPVAEYNVQRRGGKGITGVKSREDDFTEHVMVAHNHSMLLMFTNRGRVYSLDTYKVPLASRVARGYPLVNLLKLEEDEKVSCAFAVTEMDESGYLFFATQRGYIKRTKFDAYSRIRTNGLIALKIADDDQLIGVARTDGTNDIMLIQSSGKLARFKESDVRVMGRTARGVRGMRLRDDDRVISLIVPEEDGLLLTVSELGLGKRVKFDEFAVKSRGILGMRAVKITEKTGSLVNALQVFEGDHLLLLNKQGKFIRIDADTVSLLSRSASGVKLMNASVENPVVEVDRLADEDPTAEELAD